MRRLAEPMVLKFAGVAALLTSLACYPRLALAPIYFPVWYLELVMFVGSFVLWAFVFAWHTAYTQCEVFPRKFEPKIWLVATVTGMIVAVILHRFLDPGFKLRTPADYPTSVAAWVGMTAFALAFNPLFLTFAPFAWAVRLMRRVWIAASFTVMFGVFVMALKIQSTPTPLPTAVFLELLTLRLVLGTGSVFFYLRGGAGLVWWWAFLLQARHLLSL